MISWHSWIICTSLLGIIIISSANKSISCTHCPVKTIDFILEFLHTFNASMIFLDLHDVVKARNTSFVVPMPSICREKILSNPKSFPIQVNRDALELNDNEEKGVLLFFKRPIISDEKCSD